MPADQMGQFLQIVEQRRDDVYAALGALEDPMKKRFTLLAVAAIRNHKHQFGTCTCTSASMWQALIDACQTQLVPDTVEGHAYLISYGNELTFAIGYKGMIKVVIDEKVCDHIYAEIVRQKDFRRFKSGEKRVLIHRFDPFDTKRGNIVGVYSNATLANGMTDWEAMNLDEIEAVKGAARRTGKGKLSPAWQSFETEMIKKSALRRHMKRLQGSRRVTEASNRLAAAMSIEDREFNLSPDDYKVVTPGQTDFDTVMEDLGPKRPADNDALREKNQETRDTIETTARRVKPEPEPPPPPKPEPERTLDENEQGLVEQALSKGGWLSRDWPKILQEYAGVDHASEIKISKLPGVVHSLEQAGREP